MINVKTAKALGLTIPSSLLVAADEVIERTFRSAANSGGKAPLWVINCRANTQEARLLYP